MKTFAMGDKVKQMKEKAGKMSALSSAFVAKTVKKTTSTMKIPQIGTMSTVNLVNRRAVQNAVAKSFQFSLLRGISRSVHARGRRRVNIALSLIHI